MKNLNKRLIAKTCVLIGVTLLIAGILALIFWQGYIHYSMKKTENYVKTLQSLIPNVQGAVLEERKDNTMPVLSVDGTDFVGVIEMPKYESSLVVCADWSNLTKYPCQFNGSIYNKTMQIGATSQKGQYDFYREISVGDTVLFTDMQGNRYTYFVKNLSYEKHADNASLKSQDSALVLFVKNVYAFEYLIISCDTLN